jgi:hypothetical protein
LGIKLVTVALAKKMARIAFANMLSGNFRRNERRTW